MWMGRWNGAVDVDGGVASRPEEWKAKGTRVRVMGVV